MLNLTPEEAWSGYKPSIAHIQVFGCTAYAHVPKEKRKKLDDKSVKRIFIGYSIETRSYRLFDPKAKKVIISRDVVFDEKGIYHPEQVQFELREVVVNIGDESNSKSVKIDQVKKKPKWLERSHSESNVLDRNFERGVTISQNYLVNYALMGQVMKMDEPRDYAEALRKKEWNEAMEAKLNALVKNDTWDLVKLPKGKDVIGTKWVYKIKYKSDGTIDKYKACLVAKGYAQKEGIDYIETFALVAKLDTIRMVLALAA